MSNEQCAMSNEQSFGLLRTGLRFPISFAMPARCCLILLIGVGLSGWRATACAAAAAAAESIPRPANSSLTRMDYGSLLTYTVGLPSTPGKTNANLALKGVCIRLGGSNEAAVCFDTDLLRYYAGWTGGFLDLSKTHLTSYKGSEHALIQGDLQFQTALEPGWSRAGDFSDPRPIQAGPLPRDWGRFKALYRY